MNVWMKDGKRFSNPLVADGRRIYNPSAAELAAAGWTLTSIEPPPPADRTAFDAACAKFREICATIGEAIGEAGFKGGFDEMVVFQQSEIYGTTAGLQLAVAWQACNELCKYEGHKLGFDQPGWWYECWRQVEEAAAE